jgi:ABC-2 type transport system ATP-binding protein
MKPLEIAHLSKWYGSLRAVDDVNFEIGEGEIFGLLGPNGAGKTSIISTITTLNAPTSGKVRVFGCDVVESPKAAKYLTGCVPQELVNYGFFNVYELLQIQSGYYGLWRNGEQIEFLLDKLGLKEHRYKKVKELSGGLKRRLLIAKALVHKPKLLLLDEPTAGVDIDLRLSLWDFISELRDLGTSILLTTHYLEEAEKMCERIGVIHKGKLKLVGNTDEIVKKYTVREVNFTLKKEIAPFHHPYLISCEKNQLNFKLPSKNSIGELMTTLPIDLTSVQDVTIREGKLEDAFQKIIGEEHDTL